MPSNTESLESLVLRSDNATVVSYLKKQWSGIDSISISARYIHGTKNILVDQLSRPDQVIPKEWSLLPQVFKDVCMVFGCPHTDLFPTQVNKSCYMSPVPDPMARKQDAFQHSWDDLSIYVYCPFILLHQVISRGLQSQNLSRILVAKLWTQKE